MPSLIRRRALMVPLTVVFCFVLSSSKHVCADVITFSDEFNLPVSTVFGIPTGTVTWKTTVELIVPKTVFAVGEIGSFTILGNITNSATGLEAALTNVATVFGKPSDASATDVELAQPFTSLLEITSPKIFVGASNPWQIRAFDQASTGTSSFSGTIGGVGASYTTTVQGPSASDWFEPIGESNRKVRIENRVLSTSEHGKFTGTGASFRIDGFFQDLAPGTATLSFSSRANYSVYGLLAPPSLIDEILGQTDINLSIQLTSVPEPNTFALFVAGATTLLGASVIRRRRITCGANNESVLG